MLQDYKKEIEKIKEDLIYAMNEKYQGELEISDVAKTPYEKMILQQDKKILYNTNLTFANVSAQIIEFLESYINEMEKFDPRTTKRNSDIITPTLYDLSRAVKIYIASIKVNNAIWQEKLLGFNNKEENINENKEELNKIFNQIEKIIGGKRNEDKK